MGRTTKIARSRPGVVAEAVAEGNSTVMRDLVTSEPLRSSLRDLNLKVSFLTERVSSGGRGRVLAIRDFFFAKCGESACTRELGFGNGFLKEFAQFGEILQGTRVPDSP